MSFAEQIKSKGLRFTSFRRAVATYLENSSKPFTATNVHAAIPQFDLSTIYRELMKLEKYGLIRETLLSSGEKMYERADLAHHHHLVCNNCDSIEPIELKKEKKVIQEVEKKTKFQIQNHTLEFFGLCQSCQQLS